MNKEMQQFREDLKKIPKDISLQVDWSFSIADKIAAVLKERGMTQRDFANKMGKRETEVSRWLGGTHNFTLSTLAKISAVLDCKLIGIV